MSKSLEDLQDSEELCEYCPLDEEFRGCKSPHINCEGSHCGEAYEAYLEYYIDNLKVTIMDAGDLDVLEARIAEIKKLNRAVIAGKAIVDGSVSVNCHTIQLFHNSHDFFLTDDEMKTVQSVLKGLLLQFVEVREAELKALEFNTDL